jgi:hypothetical protein
MGRAFIQSVNGTVVFFQNMLIFLAGALIPLVFIGLAALVGYRVFKASSKNNNH